MKIVVTGANGMVARALAEHCAAIGDDITALTRTDLDISNAEQTMAVLGDNSPEAVINCAAYTNVDGAETDQSSCYAANVTGVANLAEACRNIGSAFVTISTDYVFDGSKEGFYTQRDQPDPRGFYAVSKREGEIKAFESYARSIIVRSGWIYGRGGTNFLSVMPALLAEGKPVNAISDSFGTPTYAADLARRLRELAAADLPGVYHVTNSGNGTSYLGFAKQICELSGFDHGPLQATSYVDLKRPAPRPTSSKLACLISEKLGFAPLRDWKLALAEFLGK